MSEILIVRDEVWLYRLLPPSSANPENAFKTLQRFGEQHLDQILMGHPNKVQVQKWPSKDDLELLFSVQVRESIQPKKKEEKKAVPEKKKAPQNGTLPYLIKPPLPRKILRTPGLEIRMHSPQEWMRALRDYTLLQVDSISYRFESDVLVKDQVDDLWELWESYGSEVIGSTVKISGFWRGNRKLTLKGPHWTGTISESKRFCQNHYHLHGLIESPRLDEMLGVRKFLQRLKLVNIFDADSRSLSPDLVKPGKLTYTYA